MHCTGNTETHCCIFGGVKCKYLEVDTIPGRHWVCGLMRELRDWDTVIASERYQRDIQPLCDKFLKGKYNCKTWPAEDCYCGN